MTPIDIRPSPCPSQAQALHRSVCKISPLYVTPFRRLSCKHVKATVNYCIDSTQFQLLEESVYDHDFVVVF